VFELRWEKIQVCLSVWNSSRIHLFCTKSSEHQNVCASSHLSLWSLCVSVSFFGLYESSLLKSFCVFLCLVYVSMNVCLSPKFLSIILSVYLPVSPVTAIPNFSFNYPTHSAPPSLLIFIFFKNLHASLQFSLDRTKNFPHLFSHPMSRCFDVDMT
jgi:hypothetical protein